MNRRTIIVSITILLVVILVGLFLFKDEVMTKSSGDYKNISDLNCEYNADFEIADANKKLQGDLEPATVIENDLSSSKRHIALTFDGMTDDATMHSILDLLQRYNYKATFFVEGVNAADNRKLIIDIRNAGHQIANYTLNGTSQIEKMPANKIVEDFCRSQKIIGLITDHNPTLIKWYKGSYNEEVLKIVKACGLDSVVKSDVFMPRNQLHSNDDAINFVRSIKPGSIVSVQLGTPVEAIIKEIGKTDERPAIDKQPGLREANNAQCDIKRESVVDEVERMLIALQNEKYDVSRLETFRKTNYIQTEKNAVVSLNDSCNTKPSNYLVAFNLSEIFSKVKSELVALFTCKTAYAATSDEKLSFAELREKNNGHLATEMKMIPTTEQAVIYTFGGLENEVATNDVLNRLNKLGIKATFFIFEREIKLYPQLIEKIIAENHEIGIAIKPKANATFIDVCNEIERTKQLLENKFGVEAKFVKQPWGTISDPTKEAVSALGYQLIGQSVNVVQSKHQAYQSVDEVMPAIFGKAIHSLGRGQIVHFRMDYYKNSELVGNLVETIKKCKIDNIAYVAFNDDPLDNPHNDSGYIIKSVGAVLGNTELRYQYPINAANVPAKLACDYRKFTVNDDNFTNVAAQRYIGEESVNDSSRMIGFSQKTIRRLDKKGFINTDDNVIFLTFDDWGSDAAINKILYVLRKHNVKATFFVITKNVMNNPNLLRAIAAEGHDIGSHSEWHKPLVVRDAKGRQVPTQTPKEYHDDLSTSYKKLHDIVGDVEINGKYALTRFFRPPTLAISKMGIETLFDCGYDYSISGSCSTDDYAAPGISELLNRMQNGIYDGDGKIKKGAILVMHMTDSAAYTAKTLDILLTANEARKDDDPLKFRVGRLSDYLSDGYSQIEYKNKKNLITSKVGDL